MKYSFSVNILKSKIFKRFLLSYSLVFVIPIIIVFLYFYSNSINTLKNEVHNTQILAVNQLKITIDDGLGKIKTIRGLVDGNIDVDYIYHVSKNEIDAKAQLTMLRISNALNTYYNISPLVSNVYVYFDKNDRLVGIGNARTSKDYFDNRQSSIYEDLYYEEWIDMLKGKKGFGVLKVPLKEKNKYNLYYFQSLPQIPPNIYYGCLVVKLNQLYLNKLIDGNLIEENRTIGFIDDNNNILFSNNEVKKDNINYLDFKNKSGYFKKENNMIFYVHSEEYPGAYFSIIDESIISNEIEKSNIIAIAMMTLAIFIGAILTFFITVKNYHPIRQLFDLTKAYNQEDINVEEFSKLRSFLLEGIDERIKYEKHLKNRVEENKRYQFAMAIVNQQLDREILNIPEQLGFLLNGDSFRIIRIEILDYTFKETPIIKAKSVYIQMLEIDYEIFVCSYEMNIIILINIAKADEDLLLERIKEAKAILRDEYVIDSYVAISGLHKSIEEMTNASSEVAKAIDYFEVVGRGDVVAYDEYSSISVERRIQNFIVSEEKILIGQIESELFEEAKKTINQIFGKYFFKGFKSPQLLRIRLFSLVNQVINAFARLDMPSKEEVIEKMHPYNRILNCNSAREVQTQIEMVLDEMAKYFVKMKDQEDMILKNQILEIVNDNYQNPNLNVSFVANKIGKSIDYTSKFFKKTTMIGLLDYIHRLRIKKALKYFNEEEPMTINKISANVGYASPDSFIRAFKRIEGITPGKYKEIRNNR